MIEACPLCEKPVAGESALHGHLEFAHRIDDPIGWLEERNAPPGAARVAAAPTDADAG